MGKSIIAEGKTSNEAIQKGLKELGCRLEDVDVKVLENEDKKVFFSILDPRVVKVELTVKDNVEKSKPREYVNKASEDDIDKCKENIDKFLNEFSNEFGSFNFNIEEKDKVLYVSLDGKEATKLIGYRGEVVNSLQVILSAIGNKETSNRVRVIVDVCDYKNKREKTLKELAKKLEKTVSRTGKKVVLEPMNAYERKVIHTELQNSNKVTTYSIGEEPRRKLVVDKK